MRLHCKDEAVNALKGSNGCVSENRTWHINRLCSSNAECLDANSCGTSTEFLEVPPPPYRTANCVKLKLVISVHRHKADTGIKLKRNTYLNTLLFADDQVIIQDSEDKLQKSVYLLNQKRKDYNLKISTDKTQIMAFKGKYLVRSKIEKKTQQY